MNSGNNFLKTLFVSFASIALLICLSSCAGRTPTPTSDSERGSDNFVRESDEHLTAESAPVDTEITTDSETGENTEVKTLKMKIGDTSVAVDWEENDSVAALAKFVEGGALTIRMSMYGGFVQVGSLGTRLPRDDKQTKTESGDIVLYSGDQIVVFYGSNSWAYTRLGHISDKTAEEMTRLLGNGDVTINLFTE